MATTRMRWSPERTSLALFASSGELLAVVDVKPAWSEREAVLRIFDAALTSARVLRGAHMCQVALYNPATMMTAIGSLPTTISLTDNAQVAIGPSGLKATLDDDGVFQLSSRRQLFEFTCDSFAKLSRLHEAHAVR